MIPKQILFTILIITNLNYLTKAQQNTTANKNYVLVIPNDYQNTRKSYPLIVTFKNQVTNSLLKQYAENRHTIILQINDNQTMPIESDSLKLIIQKVLEEFYISHNKIYLLGVNEDIQKTAELREKLAYYFAATAYITSNYNRFTILNNSLKLYNSVKLYFFDSINYNALDTVHKFYIQNYLWDIEVNKISQDAVKLNSTNSNDKFKKNQITISYGQWYFNNSAKSKEKTLLEIPNSMGAWQVSYARYLSKSFSANINLGILIKKIEPPRPDVFSVINGANIELEGGGIFLMPISVGIDYYILKHSFRPYAGFSLGIVPARYTYVEASGNLTNGINRIEYTFNSNAPFLELSTGFMYRIGKNTQLGLNFDYLKSRNFDQNIGGYRAYDGFKTSAVFSINF